MPTLREIEEEGLKYRFRLEYKMRYGHVPVRLIVDQWELKNECILLHFFELEKTIVLPFRNVISFESTRILKDEV